MKLYRPICALSAYKHESYHPLVINQKVVCGKTSAGREFIITVSFV